MSTTKQNSSDSDGSEYELLSQLKQARAQTILEQMEEDRIWRRKDRRTITMCACMLDRIFGSRQDKLPEDKAQLTVFHSKSVPGISIGDYLKRIVKHTRLSCEAVVVALYHINRVACLSPTFLSSLTVHRLLLASCLVCAKLMDDEHFTNGWFAKVGGVGLPELNRMEVHLLQLTSFSLLVAHDDYLLFLAQMTHTSLHAECSCARELSPSAHPFTPVSPSSSSSFAPSSFSSSSSLSSSSSSSSSTSHDTSHLQLQQMHLRSGSTATTAPPSPRSTRSTSSNCSALSSATRSPATHPSSPMSPTTPHEHCTSSSASTSTSSSSSSTSTSTAASSTPTCHSLQHAQKHAHSLSLPLSNPHASHTHTLSHSHSLSLNHSQHSHTRVLSVNTSSTCLNTSTDTGTGTASSNGTSKRANVSMSPISPSPTSASLSHSGATTPVSTPEAERMWHMHLRQTSISPSMALSP